MKVYKKHTFWKGKICCWKCYKKLNEDELREIKRND